MTRVRRVLATLLVSNVLLVVAAVMASPAEAATSGRLQTKGTGSVYSNAAYLNLGIAAGGTATFNFRVVNTSSTQQQFKLQLTSNAADTAVLYSGSTKLPSTFYTPVALPGSALAYVVKVTVPAGTPQGVYDNTLQLKDPEDNTVLDTAYATVNTAPPVNGGGLRNDLFLKTGSQTNIGGSMSFQYETSTPVKSGQSVTYTLLAKNDGTTAADINLAGGNATCGQMAVTVKKGTTDVTTAVKNGTFQTGALAPTKSVTLTVTVKLLSVSACESGYVGFTTSGPDGSVTAYAHVPVGV